MLKSFLDHFLDDDRLRALLPMDLPRRRGWSGLPEGMSQDMFMTYYYLSPMGWHEGFRPWDALERGKLPPRYRYRHFTVPKSDGGVRELAEPGVDLKEIQHNIIENYLKRQRPHRAAVGYRKGMSIADHVWPHAGARTVVTADIEDFFPSTGRYRVRGFWKNHPMCTNDRAVQLLTNLTTYRGSLPQGAPTSPALSNLVNASMDARLHRLAAECGGHYTRYADDLAFSWGMRPRPPADFEGTVRRVLHDYGYRLHARKGWRVWRRGENAEITGLVLTRDGGVDVPPEMREHMRDLKRGGTPEDLLRLAGYEGYRQMVQRGP